MRKLIYAINTTLDGCCDHTKQIADDDGEEKSIRGRFTDAISESQKASLPQKYIAYIQKKSTVSYTTEQEKAQYTLLRLESIEGGGDGE